MKRTAYFCAFMLALCLCACGSVSDAKVTSSPAPTTELMPEILPEASPEVNHDLPSGKNDDSGMMTGGSAASPSPALSPSPIPGIPDAEVSPDPALTDNAAE